MSYAVLVAGGTGGHINAAIAVGEALKDQGADVMYVTGKRPLDYQLFKDPAVLHLDSKPLRTNNPITLISNIIKNIVGFCIISAHFLKRRPKFIVGAGGYVCGPTLLAGFLQFIPVFIIEQNAVMGLTNKILGWISRRIFVHFTKTRGLSPALARKLVVVGNPTRKSIQPVSSKTVEDNLNVLVFGGSLGASQINKVIFDILKDPAVKTLNIHHQLGADQSIPTFPELPSTLIYRPMSYIENMQAEYEWCDVIIARSGASTISELAIIRKPVLIFPYPQATDNHQYFNAQIFKEESDFTIEVLDPKLPHEDSVRRVQDFLVKAHKGELIYSQKTGGKNETCVKILKEIKSHVGKI